MSYEIVFGKLPRALPSEPECRSIQPSSGVPYNCSRVKGHSGDCSGYAGGTFLASWPNPNLRTGTEPEMSYVKIENDMMRNAPPESTTNPQQPTATSAPSSPPLTLPLLAAEMIVAANGGERTQDRIDALGGWIQSSAEPGAEHELNRARKAMELLATTSDPTTAVPTISDSAMADAIDRNAEFRRGLDYGVSFICRIATDAMSGIDDYARYSEQIENVRKRALMLYREAQQAGIVADEVISNKISEVAASIQQALEGKDTEVVSNRHAEQVRRNALSLHNAHKNLAASNTEYQDVFVKIQKAIEKDPCAVAEALGEIQRLKQFEQSHATETATLHNTIADTTDRLVALAGSVDAYKEARKEERRALMLYANDRMEGSKLDEVVENRKEVRRQMFEMAGGETP